MSKIEWRVAWNLSGTSTRQALEFTQESKAFDWAKGLLRGGANEIVVTELLHVKNVHLDNKDFTSDALFPTEK